MSIELKKDEKIILDLLSEFGVIHFLQLKKFLGIKKDSIVKKLISDLAGSHGIYHDLKSNLIAINKSSLNHVDKKLLISLWVLVGIKDQVDFYFRGENPIQISCIIKNSIYEIIYVAKNNELLYNNYFQLKGDNNGFYMLIIEDLSQTKLLKIKNVKTYVIVKNNGSINFFNPKGG